MHNNYDSDEESLENLEANEGLKIYDHKKVAALLSEEYLLPRNSPTHQHGGFHTELSPLSQNPLGLIKDNVAIYDEYTSSDDHEDEEEFLSQKIPKLSQVEEETGLDQAYFPKSSHLSIVS